MSFRQVYSLLNVHILNRQSGSQGYRCANSPRHRLLILQEWAETEMEVLQAGNDPQFPQYQTEADLLSPS
jgi:hypothetical protein